MCWGFLCYYIFQTQHLSVSVDSDIAFVLWVRIITGALLNEAFRLFLLWSLLLSQALGVKLWHCGSQHHCISSENLKQASLSLRGWNTWWFRESQLISSNRSVALQASAASVHVARSGDVSWQNGTKSKEKLIKPMSEALSGLWIMSRRRLWCGGIPLEQEGVPSPQYIMQIHDALWIYFFLHLSGESGELSFRKMKVLLTTSFQRCFSQHVKREISWSSGQAYLWRGTQSHFRN